MKDPRVHGGNYTVPGTFSVSGGTNAAGTLTRWVRDTLFGDLVKEQELGGRDAYEAMMDYLPDSSKGLVCLPYLAGERMPINDPNAKGVLFGLTLEHDRGHIYRAALEAVACSLTQNVRLLEDVGLPVKPGHCGGGGTKTPPGCRSWRTCLKAGRNSGRDCWRQLWGRPDGGSGHWHARRLYSVKVHGADGTDLSPPIQNGTRRIKL